MYVTLVGDGSCQATDRQFLTNCNVTSVALREDSSCSSPDLWFFPVWNRAFVEGAFFGSANLQKKFSLHGFGKLRDVVFWVPSFRLHNFSGFSMMLYGPV